MKKGFTLIELLVVIAIIGMLSSVVLGSLNQARAKARDAKRKQDIGQIQRAAIMYFDAFGYLPRNGSGWCTYISNPTNSWGPSFQADISPTYIKSVPLDPTTSNQVGDYLYYNVNNAAGNFTLCANLEQSTGQSYNYSGCAGGAIYNYCVSI
ncbi:MAG: type II secretion system protein [Candidatus Zambryskibacteria bacterium]|nr:type II secretion system protein [Candidatus Zambryskibacteria bacterium]